jgi:hypothetical protein
MSSPHFKPSAREIVSISPQSTDQKLTIDQEENYPPSEKTTPSSFKENKSSFSSSNSNSDVVDWDVSFEDRE